jgi:hypothetical protein
MNKIEIYTMIDDINSLIKRLDVYRQYGIENYENAIDNDETVWKCKEYVKKLKAYCRAMHDKEIMIECCKINRDTLDRVGCEYKKYHSLFESSVMLYDIMVLALQEVYGISKDEAEQDKYFIRVKDGTLWDYDRKIQILRANQEEKVDGRPVKTEQPQTDGTETLSEREAKYFNKAIEAGFMEKDGTGYKWLYRDGSKASLAYFINKVYAEAYKEIPYKKTEKLFNIRRLDSAVYQLSNVKTDQKWRNGIDDLFNDRID